MFNQEKIGKREILVWVRAAAVFFSVLVSVQLSALEDNVIYPQNPFVTRTSAQDPDISIYVSANGVSRYDSQFTRKWRALTELHTYEPVVTKSLVLVGSSNGLHALDRESGVVRWRLRSAAPIFSPVVAGGYVYAAAQDGAVRALSLQNGEETWHRKFDGWIYTPAFDNDALILGGSAGKLFAVRAATGELLWSRGIGQELVYRPVRATAGMVLITTFDGWLEAVSTRNGETQWRVNESVAGFPPLVHEERLFMGAFDGTIRARNVKTGDLMWLQQFVDKLPYMPRVYGHQLIIGSDSGSVAALNRYNGNRLWQKELQINLVANPVMIGNKLVAVDEQGELFVGLDQTASVNQ